MREDALRDRVVLQAPTKHEVSIGDLPTLRERDGETAGSIPGLDDLMQRSLDRSDRDATGVDLDVDLDVVSGSHGRSHRHRSDAVRVRNLIGRLGESATGLDGPGHVPGEPPPIDLSEALVRSIAVVIENERFGNVTGTRVRGLDVVRRRKIFRHSVRMDHQRSDPGRVRTPDPGRRGQRLKEAIGRPVLSARQAFGGRGDSGSRRFIRRRPTLLKPNASPVFEGLSVETSVRALEVLIPELRGREGKDPRRTSKHEALAWDDPFGKPGRRRRGHAGNVPGSDHRRKLKGIGSITSDEHLHVTDLDLHGRPRLDVRDRLREDVGTLLFQQTRDVPRILRLLVDLAGEIAFLDLTDDHAFIAIGGDHGHHHAIHRGPMRNRKRIDRFDGHVVRITEGLSERDPDHGAADIRLDIGALKRARADHFAIRGEGIEPSTFRNLDDLREGDVGRGLEHEHRKHPDDDEERRRRESASGKERPTADRSPYRATTVGLGVRFRPRSIRIDPPDRCIVRGDGLDQTITAGASRCGVAVMPITKKSVKVVGAP